jgi:outer membrane immunogenic protein
MNKLLLGSVVPLAILVSGPSYSADLPISTKAPQPAIVAPAYSWTGCYIGGHIGGGFGRKDWSADASDISEIGVIVGLFGITDFGSDVITGFLGGFQGGCDYQFYSHFLIGAAADFSWSSLRGNHTSTFPFNSTAFDEEIFTSHTNVDRFGTFTGRIGYASDRALFYLKGGGAWVHDRLSFVDNFLFPEVPVTVAVIGTASPTRLGWTVGAGFEYALLPNLSAFVEYDYLGFGTRRVTFSCVGMQNGGPNQNICGITTAGPSTTVPLDVGQQVHAVKLGLNWHFNWGKAPTPVAARY